MGKSIGVSFFITLLTLLGLSNYAVGQQSNPCIAQTAIRVVVLGSSTAAGTGVSTSDSAWVNRYKNYMLSINPNNEVINLAQGGYTTYRIMRTGFVPPANRPNPDVNKNISAALALNPDAIIVNMPSNDVAQGYSYQEQIDNLDSIVAFSNASSVPIWICTTQPKNFSSSLLRQLQSDIKDSIQLFYSSNSIDFWTTIALADNSIDPTYDSGDGTHLNDAGHAILNQRVVTVDIPSAVYSANPSVDYGIVELYPNGSVGCGDSSTQISLVLANLGASDSISAPVILEIQNTSLGTSYSDTIFQTGGLNSCEVDTLLFYVNLYQAGNYSILAVSGNPSDTISNNDSLSINLISVGHPTLLPLNDTLCESGIGQLNVIFDSQDTVFWYSSLTDSLPISSGSSLLTGPISNTTTYYAESVRGDLFYRDEIETTLNSNINFNGAMFDVVALQNFQLDSFFVKIHTLGNQQIEIYSKTGSHIGFELDPNAWSLLGTTSVNVLTANGFTDVPLGNLGLSIGDTLGIYIQMANSSSQVSYQSLASPISRTTSEVELITGSGISHNFTNSYYPRDLNCGIYYHFGNRPEGDCSTGRIPVTAFVSTTTFDIGNDTIIDIADTLDLNCPAGFSNYNWSTGSTTDTAQIVASNLGVGIHYISASFLDSLGCLKSDSLVIAVADIVGLDEVLFDLYVYPNPATETLNFSESVEVIRIINSVGKQLIFKSGNFDSVSINQLPAGIYFIEIELANTKSILKFIKEK